MSKFTITPPEDAQITTPPLMNSKMPTKVGLYTPILAEIISWVMTNQFAPYDNNRGGEDSVDDVRVKKMAKDLHVVSMDGIKVALMTKEPMQVDGHNRLQSALIRYWRGDMTAEELNSPIAFRIVSEADWIMVYRDSHAGQKSSTKNEIIKNEDFVFGDIIKNRLFPLLTPEQRKFYEKTVPKILNNLTTVLYILHEGVDKSDYTNWNFLEVYPYRSLVTEEILYLPKGSYRINREYLEAIATILSDYYDLCMGGSKIFKHAAPKKVLKSSVFFGFYLVESLCPSSELSKWDDKKKKKNKNDKIAERLVRGNISEIDATVSLLCNGKGNEQMRRMKQLYNLLAGRSTKNGD